MNGDAAGSFEAGTHEAGTAAQGAEARPAAVGASDADTNAGHQPLADVFGDPDVRECFSERATAAAWLEVERALARAQAELGVIPAEAYEAIVREATVDLIDFSLLRERTRFVGYPILPLLEQLVEHCSPSVGRYVHWGTTTQDIMDTGRALQISRALERVEQQLVGVGDALARLAREHAGTVMVGRTHAQHAVPVTLGMKLAVWLDEMCRHLERVRAVRPRVVRVQLFGAAGTAAALGPDSKAIRRRVAELLALADANIPWHVARDGLAELGFVLAAIAATCSKIAREVIALSRPELDELRESSGHLRGASSTMPQKMNPIASETIVGLGLTAQAYVPVLLSAMLGGHERAAGEWQAEWDAVPAVFAYGGAALAHTLDLVDGLEVQTDGIARNLVVERGLLMAEALMMQLAPRLGRHEAHEAVYRACSDVRLGKESLLEAAGRALGAGAAEGGFPDGVLDPSTYVGEAVEIVACAVDAWTAMKAAPARLDSGESFNE